MYSLETLEKGLLRPKLALREFNRIYYTSMGKKSYNTDGSEIMEEDWDVLVLLDGCRYDTFADRNVLDGNLRKVESRGSKTEEFLEGNFADRNFKNTVYITANPQFVRHKSSINAEFYDVINVWNGYGWDDKYQTVLPGKMVNEAIDALKRYPNKRLIVHLIQPHYPFITAGTEFDKGQLEDPDKPQSFWQELLIGELDVSSEYITELYEENLDIVFPELERLIKQCPNKIVVTSDHRNMIGDRSRPIPITEYGHPRGMYTPELVNVPWLEIEGEQRREIISEQPVGSSDSVDDRSKVNDRLESLGYV